MLVYPSLRGGIQHSKTLLTDEHAVIGSCNWTNSSRSNQEISVLVSLNDAGVAAFDERCKWIYEASRNYEEQDVRVGTNVRAARARSSCAADRYRTAKRFSVARARAQSVDRPRE